MLAILSATLLGLAAMGLLVLAAQVLALVAHSVRPIPKRRGSPRISILKPLCGVDDELELNLESFARLDYPDVEILLGVHDRHDAAWPLACAAAARWPARFRVVVQEGSPGLNPKVNQLISLFRAARGDIVVVSDSNVRVPPDYLADIAAGLADPRVGLVTHPFLGARAERLGSIFDALHLAGSIAPGVIALKRLLGVDIVVGKSMALRRADLVALGGFAAVKDVLAEDFVLGRLVVKQLGKRVHLGCRPVHNMSRSASATTFARRYLRWSVIHRKTAGTPAYLAELALNPVLATTMACAISPSARALATTLLIAAAKTCIDALAGRILGAPRLGATRWLWVPLKDLVIGLAWLRGLYTDTIQWRGNRLRVLPGTRLARPASRRRARPARSAAIA